MSRWFNDRMGLRLEVPRITDAATTLRGGRLCRLLDRKSAALIYQRNGVGLLLFAFKGEDILLPETQRVPAEDRGFYVRSVAGRPVAMWQRGGFTYSMVGDMDRDDLLRLAKTIEYR